MLNNLAQVKAGNIPSTPPPATTPPVTLEVAKLARLLDKEALAEYISTTTQVCCYLSSHLPVYTPNAFLS